MRRTATRLAVALAACAALGLAASMAHVSVAAVDGVSMEPALHDGDLVVVRAAATYQTGDVVAYRSRRLRRVVLHRVVGRSGSHLVLRGDHNRWLDPEEADAADVLGRQVAIVPRLGHVAGPVVGICRRLLHPPPRRPARVLVTHRGTLRWTRLPDRVDAVFTYRLGTESNVNVHGWAALAVDVTDAGGSRHRISLRPTAPFTGDHVELHGQLDLGRAGLGPTDTVTLAPTVVVDGSVAGRPLRQSYAPLLSVDLAATGGTQKAATVTAAVLPSG